MPEKKIGRPKGRKYIIRKEILLTLDQAKKWNPDKIRAFLNNGKASKKISSDRDSNKDQLVDKIVSNMKKAKKNYKIEELRQLDIRTREVKQR